MSLALPARRPEIPFSPPPVTGWTWVWEPPFALSSVHRLRTPLRGYGQWAFPLTTPSSGPPGIRWRWVRTCPADSLSSLASPFPPRDSPSSLRVSGVSEYRACSVGVHPYHSPLPPSPSLAEGCPRLHVPPLTRGLLPPQREGRPKSARKVHCLSSPPLRRPLSSYPLQQPCPARTRRWPPSLPQEGLSALAEPHRAGVKEAASAQSVIPPLPLRLPHRLPSAHQSSLFP